MYSSIHKVDVIAGSPSGTELYILTDHRCTAEIEAEPELSVLLALARVLTSRRLARQSARAFEVQYRLNAEFAPRSLQDVLSATGAKLEINARSLRELRPLEPVSATPAQLADDALRNLAARVARRESLALDGQSLELLERRFHGSTPTMAVDEILHVTRLMELAAFAGEVLRYATHGSWVEAPRELEHEPFAFCCDRDPACVLDVFGHARRAFTEGPHRGPHVLLEALPEVDGRAASADAVEMLRLEASSYTLRDRVQCEPLCAHEGRDELDIPLVARGQRSSGAFVPHARDAEDSRSPGVSAQALLGLATVEVETAVATVDGLKMIRVTGHDYAAEKLLDEDFVRSIHRRVGSDLLVAAVPTRGLLILADAHDAGSAVLAKVSMQTYADAMSDSTRQADAISPTAFLVSAGKVLGIAAPERCGGVERAQAKKRGFFARLFT